MTYKEIFIISDLLWLLPAFFQRKTEMRNYFLILFFSNALNILFRTFEIRLFDHTNYNTISIIAFCYIMIFFTRFINIEIKKIFIYVFSLIVITAHIFTFYVYHMFHFDSLYFIVINLIILVEIIYISEFYILSTEQIKYYFMVLGILTLWNIVQKALIAFGYYDIYTTALVFEIIAILYFSIVRFEESGHINTKN